MDKTNNDVRDEFVRRLGDLSSIRKSTDAAASNADVDGVTNEFRWLRNHSTLLDADNKRELLESGLVDTCSWFCDRYLNYSPLGRSVLMQFLANFSANNEHVQLRIYQGIRHTLRDLILHTEDFKLLNNSIMLLYNSSLFNNNSRQEILKDVEIVQKIMVRWSENEIEYSKIFLDSVFSNSKDFLFLYKNLPDSSKTQLMDLLFVWLNDYQNDVAIDVINVIKNNFFMDCTIEEITKHVINVLAKASCVDKFNLEIKKDTLLLKKLMNLLAVIHERGKNTNGSNEEFSHIKDLSVLFVNSDLIAHDRYWFKSDVIRLIANMCYNNQEHQNLMRSNNVIPILLECCSFDAKNPLMREWSLFALKNILEGNLDNQNFVANIDSVGPIDCESSVLLSNSLGMATVKNNTSNSDTMFI